MAIFRIYPEKSNTVANGLFSDLNSGQNAVTDLWYGGGKSTELYNRNSISRFLMYFNIDELKTKIDNLEINPSLIKSYRLCLTNAIPSDKILEDEYEFNVLYKKIATSFDLISFPIEKSWDEGRGYDLIKERYLVKQTGNPLISGYSNWDFAKQNESWSGGTTANTVNAISEQHFDIGNENINLDISSLVNNWINGTVENNGVGIAYKNEYELISGDTRFISSFFTEKTNTAFKPYIEVVYNQNINDDRLQVSKDRPSKLFLYTYNGHQPANILNLSNVTVDIMQGNNMILSSLTPTHLSKGVYYVELLLSGSSTTEGMLCKDIWNNVNITSYDNNTITQNFRIQKSYYSNTPNINEYSIDVYGLDDGSTITHDDNIRIFCDLRTNYSNRNESETKYDLEYQLILNNQIEVISWDLVNQAVIDGCKTNFFDLDASWLLHNQAYQINFRIKEMGTSRVLPENINFKVIKPF